MSAQFTHSAPIAHPSVEREQSSSESLEQNHKAKVPASLVAAELGLPPAIGIAAVPVPSELQSQPAQANFPTATPVRRKRGRCMSRRIGQDGNVFQRGFASVWNPKAPAYGRYWIDVPGCEERKRRVVALGVCSSRSIAKQKLREHIEREGINTKQYFNQNTPPATTFKAQAAKWIAYMSTRRRKPVKPATIWGWQHALDKWLIPHLGDRLLADISNGALRELVEKMMVANLSAQTIVTYAKIVKMVLASAVDGDGDQLYPRKWNHDFIGLPIVEKEMQRRPTVTSAEVEHILANSKRRYAVLFALLAGTGLRIGEALALKVGDLAHDSDVLYVRRSIWGGEEQPPKTPNAVREVDIPAPLARLLRDYMAGKSGYIFDTAKGTALQQRNALGALHAAKKVGFHAFRRFRTEVLRRARVPEDLLRLWLGHSKKSITDFYADGLKNDSAWRQEWCERAGLGFSLNGLIGLQSVVSIETARVA
jgi:integrase